MTTIAAIQGLRGTGQFGTDERPTNYRQLFTMLEPNGDAPLNALLSMGASESTDDPKYNNFRDELPDRRFQINNGVGYDASTTTLQLDTGSEVGFVVAGTVIVNANTGEVMHATANGNTSTDQITVTRNIGGTALTITDNDVLFVAGHAAQEGASAPTAMSWDPTVAFNYTQIFRQAVNVTNTQKSTYLRTGDKEQEQLEKGLKLHVADMERAMFFGRRHILNGSTAQPTRFTGGIFTQISQVTDAASAFTTANTITEDEFDRFLIETVFKYGSKEKIAFVGPRVAGHMMAFGKNRWQPESVQGGTYGVSFVRYQTTAGTLLMHLHPQFRQLPAYDDAMAIIDFPYLKYRYLEDRDTSLLENRQGNSEDQVLHEYLTECGLELLQDRVHTWISNWQAIS